MSAATKPTRIPSLRPSADSTSGECRCAERRFVHREPLRSDTIPCSPTRKTLSADDVARAHAVWFLTSFEMERPRADRFGTVFQWTTMGFVDLSQQSSERVYERVRVPTTVTEFEEDTSIERYILVRAAPLMPEAESQSSLSWVKGDWGRGPPRCKGFRFGG